MTSDTPLIEAIQAAAADIRSRIDLEPEVGIILGSSLGPLADAVTNPTILPYDTIPHFPQTSVVGHAGRLVVGYLEGKAVLVMQGRFHFYEGHAMQTVTLPVRVMQALNVKTLIVTNAAGGLNRSFSVGDLMLITDHINLTGLSGFNPLRGPNLEAYGPRFPSMVAPYDLALQELARQVATRNQIRLQEGVYVSLAGPTFETPAEIRFLQIIGGDAVGMSTAPEVVIAGHGGMRVLGLSGITNIAVTDPHGGLKPTHEEVLAGGPLIVPQLITVVRGVLAAL